jgi:hypothetical protein
LTLYLDFTIVRRLSKKVHFCLIGNNMTPKDAPFCLNSTQPDRMAKSSLLAGLLHLKPNMRRADSTSAFSIQGPRSPANVA